MDVCCSCTMTKSKTLVLYRWSDTQIHLLVTPSSKTLNVLRRWRAEMFAQYRGDEILNVLPIYQTDTFEHVFAQTVHLSQVSLTVKTDLFPPSQVFLRLSSSSPAASSPLAVWCDNYSWTEASLQQSTVQGSGHGEQDSRANHVTVRWFTTFKGTSGVMGKHFARERQSHFLIVHDQFSIPRLMLFHIHGMVWMWGKPHSLQIDFSAVIGETTFWSGSTSLYRLSFIIIIIIGVSFGDCREVNGFYKVKTWFCGIVSIARLLASHLSHGSIPV